MRFIRFEPTPNPNALKCVIEQADPASGIRSYFDEPAARAEPDPLAHALFDLPGITNLLLHTEFITVGKAPDARWSTLKPKIKAAILAHAPNPTDA